MVNRQWSILIFCVFCALCGCVPRKTKHFDPKWEAQYVQGIESLRETAPLPSPPEDVIIAPPDPYVLEESQVAPEKVIAYPLEEHNKLASKLKEGKEWKLYGRTMEKRAANDKALHNKTVDSCVNEAKKAGDLKADLDRAETALAREKFWSFWKGIAGNIALIALMAL